MVPSGCAPNAPSALQLPIVLTIVWLIVVTAVLSNWVSRIRPLPRLEMISKPVATTAIGALAVLRSEGSEGRTTAAVIAAVVGFVLCLFGDVALLPVVDRFVVGLGAFLAGHVAFVVMFIALGLDRWWLGAIIGLAILALFRYVGVPVIAGASQKDSALRAPVVGYFVVISAMAIVGWSTAMPAALVGCALFVVSDSILGWRTFVESKPWMPLAVMVTYHGALLGLALCL